MKKIEFDIEREDLKEVKKKMLSKLKNSDLLKMELSKFDLDEKILDNNISVFTDYLTAIEEVNECIKLGRCLHSDHYHARSLKIDNNFIQLQVELCPVYFAKQALITRFVVKDFPESYFKLDARDLQIRKGFALYIRELKQLLNDPTRNLYVSGKNGIGKLQTAISFLKLIAENNEHATLGVLNLPKFIREYVGDYYVNKMSIDQYLQNLFDIDYLVLDDFGNEENNRLIRDVIVFPLISERINRKKSTIFLSQITLDELRQLYDYTGRDVRTKQIINAIRSAINQEIILTGTSL